VYGRCYIEGLRVYEELQLKIKNTDIIQIMVGFIDFNRFDLLEIQKRP